MATVKDGKGVISLSQMAAGDLSLVKREIGRPAPGDKDVKIEVKFCGMCHSDVHACDGSWGIPLPLAPGHEVAGVVAAVGKDVTQFKVGDRVGVGCMVNSCRKCDQCIKGFEQYCPQMQQTYGSAWKSESFGHAECDGVVNNGGYSSEIVVDEHFVLALPAEIDDKMVGPLLCAGITTYGPLARHILHQKKENAIVGVVGFGGLGMMAVKIAKAMGAKVVVFSRSEKKKADAEAMGAELVVHGDAEAMGKCARTVDVIIDTVSAQHDISKIMSTLQVGGTIVMLGADPSPVPVSMMSLIFSQYRIEGSLIGGIAETKEMLEFCTKHKVYPTIKVISAKEATAAFLALQSGSGDAVRNVIDMSTLKDL